GHPERTRAQRLRVDPPARSSRRARRGDGLLPAQQRGDRGGGGAPRGRRARADRRLGRAPRQRDAAHVRRSRRRHVHVRAPVPVLSGHRRRPRGRIGRGPRRDRQLPAARRPGRRGLRRRVPRPFPAGGADVPARPGDRVGGLRRARARSAGRDARQRGWLRRDGQRARPAGRRDLRWKDRADAGRRLRPAGAGGVGARDAGGDDRSARGLSEGSGQRDGGRHRRGARGTARGGARRAEDVMVGKFRWTFGSGPEVATLFAQGLAVVSLIAGVSLGVQVRGVIGSRGLLPVADFIEAARAQLGVSLADLPTLAWWFHSDAALTLGVGLGIALSLAAFFGLARRTCFALSTVLYLSYVTVTRDFLSFQWDNLLIECGFLAVFLPTFRTDAPAPVAHFVFRLVLFKLYFESGIAKWGS